MSHTILIDDGRPRGLAWPVAAAAVPLLYAWIAWSWWGEIRTQLAALPETGAAHGIEVLAAAAVAARIPSVLSEAALYTLWWRARGLRLPYWRFVCCVAMFSTIDLFGFAIRRAVEDTPQALRLIGALLAGPAGIDAPAIPGSGSGAAFGNLGLFTLARVIMTAWAQARGIERPLGAPLLVTTLAWLFTRLVAWWSVDLLRGLSPVP